jgi:hypothetical protein
VKGRNGIVLLFYSFGFIFTAFSDAIKILISLIIKKLILKGFFYIAHVFGHLLLRAIVSKKMHNEKSHYFLLG